jgi:hypothetical protein
MQVGACLAPPPPVTACDPGDKARCDGANIRYCYAGRTRSYFCKAFGFNKCETGKAGVHCAK